jgi:hypothetical protein
MHPFKTVSSTLLVAAAILMLAAPAMAGKGYGSGYRQGGGKTGSGIRQRLRDGSCRGVETAGELDLTAAKRARTGDRTGTPTRDRLKDGSCRGIETGDDLRLAADQLRIKDVIKLILKDESCQEEQG